MAGNNSLFLWMQFEPPARYGLGKYHGAVADANLCVRVDCSGNIDGYLFNSYPAIAAVVFSSKLCRVSRFRPRE